MADKMFDWIFTHKKASLAIFAFFAMLLAYIDYCL